MKMANSEKNGTMDFFDKMPYLYEKPLVVPKQIIKQKMQGAVSFVESHRICKIK